MHRTTVGAFTVLAVVGLGVAIPATASAAPSTNTCPTGWQPGYAMNNQGITAQCVVVDRTANPVLTGSQVVQTKPAPAKPAQHTQHTTPAKPAKPAKHLTPAKPAQPAQQNVTPAKPGQHLTPAKPAKPARHTTPTQHTTPAKPAKPAHQHVTPAKSAKPVKHAQPVV